MQQTIKKDELYLLSGPAKVDVQSGFLEVIAAKVIAGKSISIPAGKRVPLLGVEDSTALIEAPEEALSKMEQTTIPAEWDELAARIVTERKDGTLHKVLVLGEVDTGKTFFCTYLANTLNEKLGKVAILDCDSGQSDIGAPGTFGMLVLDEPAIFLTELEPTHTFFLGAHSPGLHFAPTLVGVAEMLRKAEKEADALIIDTTGWVQGDGGRTIKKAKLDIVQPDLVVLLQRGTELEHLVKHLPAEKIVRFSVSMQPTSPSQMDRRAFREFVSKKYFVDSKVFGIPFKQVFTDRCYFLSGSKIELDGTLHAEKLSGWEGTLVVTSGPLMPEITKDWPKDLGIQRNFIAGNEKGLMIALLDQDQNMLALGRLEEFDFLNDSFRIRSNYKGDLNSIKGIQFGSLKINEVGEESGFIEPGSF